MEAPTGQPPPKQTFRDVVGVTVIVLICAVAVYGFVVFLVWMEGASLAQALWLGPLVVVIVVPLVAAWDWIRGRLPRRLVHH